jgi:hypothetical protein
VDDTINKGKNFKILGVRQSLIGDCIMALPILGHLEREYPDSYKYWHIAKKCSQAAPLFYNHPLIDRIVITDCEEGFGPKDKALAESCDIAFNTMPPCLEPDFHNYRDMGEEVWVMAGLPEELYHELSDEDKTPKLEKWFDIEKEPNTIAVHCYAGYGKDQHRSPSKDWWDMAITCLIDKFDCTVYRLGHPIEPKFDIDKHLGSGRWDTQGEKKATIKDCRSLSFFDQIKKALSTDLYIGTDSGFSLAMGAYSHPQVTLLTNWNAGHMHNPLCLQPMNKLNRSLFNPFENGHFKGGCSGINIATVMNTVDELLKV